MSNRDVYFNVKGQKFETDGTTVLCPECRTTTQAKRKKHRRIKTNFLVHENVIGLHCLDCDAWVCVAPDGYDSKNLGSKVYIYDSKNIKWLRGEYYKNE